RIAARLRKREHEPRGNDAGRKGIPGLHGEGLGRRDGGDGVIAQPQRRVDHVIRVVVPNPEPRGLEEVRPRPHDAPSERHQRRKGRGGGEVLGGGPKSPAGATAQASGRFGPPLATPRGGPDPRQRSPAPSAGRKPEQTRKGNG